MPRIIDMRGLKFGRLEVIEEVGRDNAGNKTWLCRCDCGNEKVISGGNIRAGHSLSCGCFRLEQARKKTTRHGMRHTRVYNVWLCLIQRCTNPLNPAYGNYGGRGIQVCDKWRDFPSFYADMGDVPEGMQIDRIDVNGNYEPGNCRWLNKKGQARNKRTTRILTYQGKSQSLADWSEELGINYFVLHSRLRRGWSDERTLSTAGEDETL